MAALNAKQLLFVEEYLVDLNATRAAVRAGYSDASARQIGAENLSKPSIQDAIRERFEARANRLGLTQDKVIERLMAIAFADLRQVASWNADGEVALVPSDDLEDEKAASIKEVSSSTSIIPQAGDREPIVRRTVKIRQHEQLRALELLGKHLGMFNEKLEVEHSGTVGLSLSKLVELADEPDDSPGA
jgi:phage terminase small subunit